MVSFHSMTLDPRGGGGGLVHLQIVVFLCWSFLGLYLCNAYQKAFIFGQKVPISSRSGTTRTLPYPYNNEKFRSFKSKENIHKTLPYTHQSLLPMSGIHTWTKVTHLKPKWDPTLPYPYLTLHTSELTSYVRYMSQL